MGLGGEHEGRGDSPDLGGAGRDKAGPGPGGIDIRRNAYDLETAHRVLGKANSGSNEKSLKDLASGIHLKTRPKSWRKFLNRYLPISDWLVNYDWRNDLMADAVAGFTIAIMHIPQGMAYASLANVDLIYGIYTAIFPVFIYTLLGPSRHVSMGTNPLTAILVGSVISKYAYDYGVSTSASALDATAAPPAATEDQYSMLEVMTSLCLLCGIWQTAFAILGLGRLSWILSEVLVSGYTAAAAIHVVASQIKGIFGMKLDSHDGPLKIINILIEFFSELETINWATVAISVVCIAILVVNNEFLKPQVSKHCSFPVPIQLIVVAVATAFSYAFNFNELWNIETVGELPTGFPLPEVPKASIFKNVIVESLIISIVGYSITLSMAKIFATKFDYRVDGNQEMFSEGVSNLFGSFFASMPSGASMSRSSVQVAVGGRTQLTSAVSIAILIVVVLFAGPLFAALPDAVLASIIVVALKSMLLQTADFSKFWSRSKLDGLLWLGTYVAVLVLDIDSGLIVGVGLNLLLLLYRSFHVSVKELGEVGDTGILVELNDSELAARPSEAAVIRVGGAISFANWEDLFERLTKRVAKMPAQDKKCVILDLSGVPYADQTGAKALNNWLKADKENKRIVAGPSGHVESMLLTIGVDSGRIFVTVLDALRSQRKEKDNSSVAVIAKVVDEGEDNKAFEQGPA